MWLNQQFKASNGVLGFVSKAVSLFVVSLSFCPVGFADWEQDRESIRSLGGCYEIDFRFWEYQRFPDDYAVRSPDYHEKATEWVAVDENASNGSIELQHILIVKMGNGDSARTMNIKHWAETWVYEPSYLMSFKGNSIWERVDLKADEVKGMWLQAVSQVDDSPRYSGVAPWIHWPGHSYWESESKAPLPRREYETNKRTDYNLMERRNRHELTTFGYFHEQDNKKTRLVEGNSSTIALEKGMNTYRKVDDSFCSAAKKYWDERSSLWGLVKDAWRSVEVASDMIQVKDHGGKLNKELSELVSNTMKTDKKPEPAEVRAAAEKIIRTHLED